MQYAICIRCSPRLAFIFRVIEGDSTSSPSMSSPLDESVMLLDKLVKGLPVGVDEQCEPRSLYAGHTRWPVEV